MGVYVSTSNVSTNIDSNKLQSATRPIVWSIAGSDSGGGAGIQADSLTINDLGGHACTVVSAITAQNSQQVQGITATQTAMLIKQLDCLLEDIPPAAIKIGMLANAEQIRCISEWLASKLASYEQTNNLQIPVIWDPVMVSTSGQTLSRYKQPSSYSAYLQLAKYVTLITPNRYELGVLLELSQLPNHAQQEELTNLDNLANFLGCNILYTGGDVRNSESHNAALAISATKESALYSSALDHGSAIDWLAAKAIPFTSPEHQHQRIGFSSPRVVTQHNHGTGCTLSSAIATAMAVGYPLLDAIVVAKAYVHQGLTYAYPVGKGPGVLARKGWPQNLEHFAKIIVPKYPNINQANELSFANVQQPLQVYPVTQSINILKDVLKGGARTVQLRLKNSSSVVYSEQQLEQAIQAAVALGRQYQAQVFINDHWQLAIKHGAFGVHLGQEDLLQADLSQIAEAGLALGLSSHGYFELLLAQQMSPSYLAIGHIFSTPTKSMPSQPQGLNKLEKYCTLMGDRMPLVAIGGIDHTNLRALKQTQVADVAVVRAIEKASEPGKSWQKLQQIWQAM
ncbi:thiamine phosphate synthase [Alteromonas sp. M12]|uniref:thiamine phosphate synthase n=1 Tax=Alteromonas sp. M12 TaxID=3135644 RepID=UPI00319DDAFD